MTILVTGLLLITIPCFSSNASANGVGTIEVKVTRFGSLPILNADVTGEDMSSHEVSNGVMGVKNGTYYINFWFNPPIHYRDIHVKVVTKALGIQEEDVYNLHDSDVVKLEFNFGFKSESRTSLFGNHWDFPILERILHFLFNNILMKLG